MSRIVFTHAPDAQAAADWLTARLASADHGPFDRPVILAPHPALQRFLTLEVARRTGIAASLRSLTPTAWVDEVTGLEGTAREWRPAAMAWAVVDLLRDPATPMPEFIRRIVRSGDDLAVLHVARVIAQRFRTYLLHEPGILERAESGAALLSRREEHERWQREMWLRLIARIGTDSPTAILRAAAEGNLRPVTGLPRAVYIVSEPGVPPSTRVLLTALAEQCAIAWCVLDHAPLAAERYSSPRKRAAVHALAALGYARSQALAAPRTLLERTQALLRTADAAATPGALDDTLTVHRCHSPLREIETLRERALDALVADPALRPHDITLYVTSLEEYLPAIDIAFADGVDGNPRIPFSVAGRPLRERSAITGSVLDLLRLVDGRHALREIGSFLTHPNVAAAAGFGEDEVPEALELLARARVTWGRDANDRTSRFGLPELNEGTWREGIDCLTLGIATGPSDSTVAGLRPVAGETLGAASLLARIIAWSEALFETCDALRDPRPAREWSSALEAAVRRLVQVDDAEAARDLRKLREALDVPLAAFSRLAPDAPLALSVVRAVLDAELGDGAARSGHLRGGLRVCRLEPGTVLPSAVVLIAGLGDAQHPGGSGSLSWDLLNRSDATTEMTLAAEHPDGRADALDTFRAAVCSAGARLHLSWTGVTLSKQEERGPSIALSELREAAERSVATTDRQRIVRLEPPHPFSRRVFSDDAGASVTKSGATTWLAATQAIGAAAAPNAGFGQEAPSPTTVPSVIALDVLATCVADPTRHFVRRAMGIATEDEDEELPEREAQGVAARTASGAASEYRGIAFRIEDLVRANRRRSRDAWRLWLRRQPEMPFGTEGDEVTEELLDCWWERLAAAQSETRLAPLTIAVRLDPFSIEGRIDQLTSSERRVFHLYPVRPESVIGDWVRHLVLNQCALEQGDVPRRTVFDAPDGWAFAPVQEPTALLRDLCELYAEASRRPVALMRKSGVALLKAGDAAKARAAAFTEWHGTFRQSPEQELPWHRLCWPARDVLVDDDFFAAIRGEAERYLAPMLAAVEEAP